MNESEFPRQTNDATIRFFSGQGLLSDEHVTLNAAENIEVVLETGYYKVPGAGMSATDYIEGEISRSALRDNVSDLWDVEDGEEIDVTVFEQWKDQPRVYEGTITAISSPESFDSLQDWNMVERGYGGSDYFKDGGVLVKRGPEDMESGMHNFVIENRTGPSLYCDVETKLRNLFGYESRDVNSAIQVLDSDYERFSSRRWQS